MQQTVPTREKRENFINISGEKISISRDKEKTIHLHSEC